MLCKHCGNIVPDNALVCPQCGADAGPRRWASGAAGIRQGRPDRKPEDKAYSAMPYDDEPSAEGPVLMDQRRRRGEKAEFSTGAVTASLPAREKSGRKQKHSRPVNRFAVNWALVWVFVIVLLFLGAAGTFAFLKYTDRGQLIMARMGQEANATALWAYGQELYDQGYLNRAIATFEKAYELEPEREDIYDLLLQLADVYESNKQTAAAEAIYVKLYTEVDEKNPAAYRAMERLLDAQGRRMELASFLQTAYDKTDDAYFRRQREALLPAMPTADEKSGSRRVELDVQLQSDNDYEIYYIQGDEGILPEDGIKYEKPIHLAEGYHVIRAVAVSSDLVSDELRITYSVRLLEPMAPVTTLAPGEYNKRYKIGIRYVPSEDEEKSQDPKIKDITIYYTLDGQTPNSNSPIFTGEQFQLPAGKSTVKAIAVNGYGKVSNVMERTFKVNVGYKGFFGEKDEFSDFVIMKTTREEFQRKYGTPVEEETIAESTMPGTCMRARYSWGEARFWMSEQGYLLYALETSSRSVMGPRKTKIGMSETEVTELYRDMGQPNDQNGDRSIYNSIDDNGRKVTAKLYYIDEQHDRIDYAYTRADRGVVTLSYYLENGKVVKMGIRCQY